MLSALSSSWYNSYSAHYQTAVDTISYSAHYKTAVNTLSYSAYYQTAVDTILYSAYYQTAVDAISYSAYYQTAVCLLGLTSANLRDDAITNHKYHGRQFILHLSNSFPSIIHSAL